MGIQRRLCANHPDRPAIGICVITAQAICAECSTRYEGVNYSREGLRILRERRKALESRSPASFLMKITLLVLSPLMLLLVYLSYSMFVDLLMKVVHWGLNGMPRDPLNFDARRMMQSQGPVTGCLDTALEYLRARGLRLLPAYLIGMLPFSVAALFLIDAISAQHRSSVLFWCLALLPATLWRWGWLGRLQQLVQQDIQAQQGLSLRRRLLWILVMRLYCNIAVTWGGTIVVPAYYGLFAGSFCTPVLLERDGPAVTETFRMLGWVHHSMGRLSRALTSMTLFALVLTLGAYILERTMIGTVLPSFLGIDASEMALTTRSWAWFLSCAYFLFLAGDFAWTVAAVFLYFDAQSRRTGSDLRSRMQILLAARPGAAP